MSKQRDKGTKWSTAIENYLQEEGFTVRRQALYGANDRGDLHIGTEGNFLVCEAKNQSRHSLAEWVEEAQVENDNAGGAAGFAWFHRRGFAHPRHGYVLMTGAEVTYLMREAGLS